MSSRVAADGKHLSLDGKPWRAKGVTYGGFAARLDGARFPERARIKEDLVAIAHAGLNTVRVYELPPVELLDIAAEQGLRVLVGIDYHDWRQERHTGRGARRRIRDAGLAAMADALKLCSGRSEVLAVAVGNEVPADLVRVHGAGHVAETLGELVAAVHDADPGLLATYVSYPTTEFLEVEGQDLTCLNVFLEDPDSWRRYLRHLQVISSGRPLLLTELGLAGAIHGDATQAETLEWQLRILDETGCAGGMVYAWTDEWAVNDQPVTGWGFGITTEDRAPKPALSMVSQWAGREIAELRDDWPRVSVVVCAYNEELTLRECLDSLAACDYPNLEVIVCDDGSTDRTAEIIRSFPFRLLELPHGGLSRARNAGLEVATGDIVAYLDADAACHPEWPYHLALSLEDEGVVATGGPNLPFLQAGLVERAVAASPGGPAEVLVADDRAEHVPGCNMAFRPDFLKSIGGFNAAYTAAGDDVDVCWKLLDQGDQIGFSPAAQVRHHRRATVKGYLKQQRGYGRAERMLSGPHRHRFNALGQATWKGVIYGGLGLVPSLLRPVVYHGWQGQAPYQPIVSRRAERLGAWIGALLPLTLPIAVLGALLMLVSPWFVLIPAFMALIVADYGAAVAVSVRLDHREPNPLAVRHLVGLFHVAQPFARLWGRMRTRPLPSESVTPEWWGDRAHWLATLRSRLEQRHCRIRIGGPDQSWDLRATVGLFVAARVTTAVVWDWEPRWRVGYRPRWWLLVPVVAGLSVLFASVPAGAVVLGAVALTTAFEFAMLRRRLRSAIEATTEGARQ